MATIYLRNVPENIQRKFKAKCAEKGANMTQVIQSAMTAVVEGKFEIDEETKSLFAGVAPAKEK